MPRLRWLPEALGDVERLHAFLLEQDRRAAARAAARILEGSEALAEHPRLGRPMGDGRREWVVRFGAGAYVLRYRLTADGDPVIIRVWHSREVRG